MSDAYSDAASFGRSISFIFASIVTFISLIMLFLGLYMIYINVNNSRHAGLVIIVTALIMFLIAWLWYWIVERSKFIAAAYGTEEVYQIVK